MTARSIHPPCDRCDSPQVEVSGEFYGLCYAHLRDEYDIDRLYRCGSNPDSLHS